MDTVGFPANCPRKLPPHLFRHAATSTRATPALTTSSAVTAPPNATPTGSAQGGREHGRERAAAGHHGDGPSQRRPDAPTPLLACVVCAITPITSGTAASSPARCAPRNGAARVSKATSPPATTARPASSRDARVRPAAACGRVHRRRARQQQHDQHHGDRDREGGDGRGQLPGQQGDAGGHRQGASGRQACAGSRQGVAAGRGHHDQLAGDHAAGSARGGIRALRVQQRQQERAGGERQPHLSPESRVPTRCWASRPAARRAGQGQSQHDLHVSRRFHGSVCGSCGFRCACQLRLWIQRQKSDMTKRMPD